MVRMVPVKIHHIISFKIKCLIPKALKKIVIDQALHIMGPCRNTENIDGSRERDRCIEPAQLAPEVSHSFAGCVALVRRQFAEAFTNVGIAKLSRRAHFLVDVKEELAPQLKLAIETANGVTRVRRVVKHAISDDQVK